MTDPVLTVASERDDEAAAWCIRMATGAPSAEDYDGFIAWLESDADNGARFDMAAAIWSAVELQAEQPDMLRLREETLSDFRQAQTRRWSAGRRWSDIMPLQGGWTAAIAACLVGAVALLILFAATTPERFATGPAERRVVMLDDGSRLSLDADSEVAVHYSRSRRDLDLVRGRASFSVAKNPNRPFTVESDGERIVAVGTRFSVERLRGQTQVILYEGHVRIMHDDGTAATSRMGARGPVRPAEQLLVPGARLILPRNGALSRVDVIPSIKAMPFSAPPAWEIGQIEFDDEPLGVAVERMNRYAASNRRITVSPDVARLPVSGVFNAAEPATFAVEMAAIFDLQRTVSAGGIALARR